MLGAPLSEPVRERHDWRGWREYQARLRLTARVRALEARILGDLIALTAGLE